MSQETWLQRAERLRSELARLDAAQLHDPEFQRTVIARFLRTEFGDEQPDDSQTMALFPGEDLA